MHIVLSLVPQALIPEPATDPHKRAECSLDESLFSIPSKVIRIKYPTHRYGAPRRTASMVGLPAIFVIEKVA